MTTETSVNQPKRKRGIGSRILLGIAGVIGIGWQVMLVIIRVLGIVAGIILSPIVGIIVLASFPEAPSLVHWAAFILTPFIVWGLTELFIWFNSDPLESLVY